MEYDLDIFSDLPAEIFDGSIDTFLSRILNEFKKEYSDYVEKHSDECMYLKMPRLLYEADDNYFNIMHTYYISPEKSWYLNLHLSHFQNEGLWCGSILKSNKFKDYGEIVTNENATESMKKLVEFIFIGMEEI